jgi:Cysteine-rich CPXCG
VVIFDYQCNVQTEFVTCPTCFESFEVAMPALDEMPTEVDYDCEICCRPMLIVFTEQETYAKGLAD